MIDEHGVLAAIPSVAGRPSFTLLLDRAVSSGHPGFWMSRLMSSPEIFSPEKATRLHSDNRMMFEAVTLQDDNPDFFPEGDAYGCRRSDLDQLIDAGVKVEVRMNPYMSDDECVVVKDASKQRAAIAKEFAFMFEMSEKAVAPPVLAAFCDTQYEDNARKEWLNYSKPTMLVEHSNVMHRESPEQEPVRSVVVVSQVSTFSLGDMMAAMRDTPVEARREHLSRVIEDSCGAVFDKIKQMCEQSRGGALVKLNMTPDNVVFCPKLVDGEDGWKLDGFGHMPVSKTHIDGVPHLTDFNSVLTTRIREESHSYDTSYVMHSMLLVAFARSQYGPGGSDVLWKHLLADGDPSGFVAATREMKSSATNASSFIASLADNFDMREFPALSKALDDTVSDMNCVVTNGVVDKNNDLSMNVGTSMFEKLVCIVTNSASVDTLIFARHEGVLQERMEVDIVRALEDVKLARAERLNN